MSISIIWVACSQAQLIAFFHPEKGLALGHLRGLSLERFSNQTTWGGGGAGRTVSTRNEDTQSL
jgi:hypothetical protein